MHYQISMKTPKYTINQFRKEFANDDVCLDRLFAMRYKSQPCCPQCSQETTFKRIPGRRSYQCSDSHCQYQLYPTAGTIFEKTRTSLADWFYAIYLMTSTKNGVAAKEIQRQIGVTYKCAFRMMHLIRKLMQTSDGEKMMGIVEVDETYITSNPKNKHAWKQTKDNSKDRTKSILAMVERNGKVVTQVIANASVPQISPYMSKNIDRSATLITDSHGSYKFIGKTFFEHIAVKHSKTDGKVQYVTHGFKHTNSVEGFFAHLKRTIMGTHISVSAQHLQAYADECAFRYTHRKAGQLMFFKILDQVRWN
jgi:transposase